MPAQQAAGESLGPMVPPHSKTVEDEALLLPDAKAKQTQALPLYAWPLLIISVLMISSAGPTFATLLEIPALTLPAWRTQCTTILLLIPGCLQYIRLSTEERAKILQNMHLILLVGLVLALDFAFWIWGLHHTSLPHSLFITSSAPPVIAIGSLILRYPISHGELIGTAIAVVGAAYLALGGKNDGGATVYGDILSVIAVLMYVLYFVFGRRVRHFVPVFTYMLLVTGSCAIFLSLGALAFEGASIRRLDAHGLFGWMNLQYLGGVAWLATGPGVIGHTGMNCLLKWMHPLQITLPQTIIPILGSILGWLMGASALPSGAATWIGGALLIAATVLVIMAGHRREAREKALQQQRTGAVQLPEVQVVLSKPTEGRPRGDRFWEDEEADASSELMAQQQGRQAKAAGRHVAEDGLGRGAELGKEARPIVPAELAPDAAQDSGVELGRLERWLDWVSRRMRWGQQGTGDVQDDQEASGLLSPAEQTELSDAVPEHTSGQRQHADGRRLDVEQG